MVPEYWSNQDHLLGIGALIDRLNTSDYVDCASILPSYHCYQDLTVSDHSWRAEGIYGAWSTTNGWSTVYDSGGNFYSLLAGPEFGGFADVTRVEADIDWVSFGSSVDVVGVWHYHLGSYSPLCGSSQYNAVLGLHTYVWSFVAPCNTDNVYVNPNGNGSGEAHVVGFRIYGPGDAPAIDCDG
jgi:hypothetical protein